MFSLFVANTQSSWPSIGLILRAHWTLAYKLLCNQKLQKLGLKSMNLTPREQVALTVYFISHVGLSSSMEYGEMAIDTFISQTASRMRPESLAQTYTDWTCRAEKLCLPHAQHWVAAHNCVSIQSFGLCLKSLIHFLVGVRDRNLMFPFYKWIPRFPQHHLCFCSQCSFFFLPLLLKIKLLQ